MDAAWLWIPATVGAALAQTFRNAAQRRLTGALGTLGATWVRFVYGLPFAALALLVLAAWRAGGVGAMVAVLARAGADPAPALAFGGWVLLGALAQIGATAALLRAMEARGFALGVAYAKTEVLMVALFGLLVLGDPLGLPLLAAVLLATLGVLLLAPADPERPLRALATGWAEPAARFGLLAGAGFGLSAVGFRGAALQLMHAATVLPAAVPPVAALQPPSPLAAALLTLVCALALQTLVMGAWLAARQPAVLRAVLALWRPSLGAGALGALASAGWFTAFALHSAAAVRTLGLVELVFSVLVSRQLFRERISRREATGLAALGCGVLLATLARG